MNWKVKRIYLIIFSKNMTGLTHALRLATEDPEYSEMTEFLLKLKALERPRYEQIEIYTLTDPPTTKIRVSKGTT